MLNSHVHPTEQLDKKVVYSDWNSRCRIFFLWPTYRDEGNYLLRNLIDLRVGF